MSGEHQADGQDLLRGAELRVRTVNRNAGEKDTVFAVVPYDDHDDPAAARRIAEELAASGKGHVIVGPTNPESCAAVAPICTQAGLPMVTAMVTPPEPDSAVPWHFCTTFNDEAQGRFAAIYLRRILGRNKVAIVHGADGHSRDLADAFHDQWHALGRDAAAYVLPLTSHTRTAAARLEDVLDKVGTYEVGCVFLAAPAPEAARFVKKLRDLAHGRSRPRLR